METRFRSDLIDWLRTDPALAGAVNAVEAENPATASPPWLGIVSSAASDWSSKTHMGRALRVVLELVERGGNPLALAELAAAIEQRVATMAPAQSGYRIAVTSFLRSRSERRKRGLAAVLFEYRFLLIVD